MMMPARKYSSESYRYGFNGKEKDKDINSLTAYDYGFRIYNPGIGRFLSVDPLTGKYPWYTPYQFAGNDVIANIDLDGGEPKPATTGKEYEGQTATTSEISLATLHNIPKRITQNWVYHEGGANGSKAGWMTEQDYYSNILKPMAKEYNKGNIDPAWNFATSRNAYNKALLNGNSYQIALGYESIVKKTGEYIKANPTVDTWDRWLPIWGSLKQAYLDFSVGKYWSGAFNTILGVSDVFLVKSIAQAPLKAMVKEGVSDGMTKYLGVGMSNEYAASVSRWKNLGLDMSGYKHHWLISQDLMEEYEWLKPFGNQTWNLTRFETQASHMRWAHFSAYPSLGLGEIPGARLLYPFSSTPTWFKLGGASYGGRLLNQ